jgi:hypothetical protein
MQNGSMAAIFNKIKLQKPVFAFRIIRSLGCGRAKIPSQNSLQANE